MCLEGIRGKKNFMLVYGDSAEFHTDITESRARRIARKIQTQYGIEVKVTLLARDEEVEIKI